MELANRGEEILRKKRPPDAKDSTIRPCGLGHCLPFAERRPISELE